MGLRISALGYPVLGSNGVRGLRVDVAPGLCGFGLWVCGFNRFTIRSLILGSGFRLQGSGFRVRGSGFRVQGSGFRVQGSGFRVQGSGFRVQGSGFMVQGSWFRVQR